MNTLNESPEAKIEKYNQKLNQRDQNGIMNALSHFNSPLLNSLGREYVQKNNIIDFVNQENPLNTVPKKVEEVPKAEETSKAKDDTTVEAKDSATTVGDELYNRVRTRIMAKESSPDPKKAYSMVNMLTDNGKPGSGAWGAYQFIWKWHKPGIEIATGYTKPEDFLNDPEAQEKYFKYHYDTVLKPYANLFKQQFPNSGLTEEQIMDGIHFRGQDSFFDIYSKGLQDVKLESNNPTLTERLQ